MNERLDRQPSSYGPLVGDSQNGIAIGKAAAQPLSLAGPFAAILVCGRSQRQLVSSQWRQTALTSRLQYVSDLKAVLDSTTQASPQPSGDRLVSSSWMRSWIAAPVSQMSTMPVWHQLWSNSCRCGSASKHDSNLSSRVKVARSSDAFTACMGAYFPLH